MFITVYRTTKFAALHFWRNFWISAITIFILTLTLFIVSLVGTLNLLADQAIRSVENKINIDFYFTANAKEDDILAAKVYLESLPSVKTVRYTSKKEALEKFKQSHVDDPSITAALAELDTNPLPATLSVQAQALHQYQGIIDQFSTTNYDQLVEKKNFSDHQAVIDRLSYIVNRVYVAGIVVSGIFVLISIVMMFNTIRMAIYSHREELGIMKLVGATNWFIRAPFLLEGVLYAFFASILAFALLAIIIFSVAPYVNNFFTGYDFSLDAYFIANIWLVLLIQFGLSLMLSIGSSMLSIGKHLKV